MSIKKMLMIFVVAIGLMIALIIGTSLMTSKNVSDDDALKIYTDFSTTYEYTTNNDQIQFGRAIAQIGEMPTEKDIVTQALITYDNLFSQIIPQLNSNEIYTLLLFSNDLNNYKSGKNENALYRKDAALRIIEKYGVIKKDEKGNVIINNLDTNISNKDAAATTVDAEGNVVPVNEDTILATDLSKISIDDTVYGQIVTAIENGAGLNMVNDSNMIWKETTNINTLGLEQVYPSLEINNIRACYQYTGDDANLEFVVGNIEENRVGEYAIYDDYEDCLRNNKAISREFTNGYSVDESNNKGQADGTISSPEVSEVVRVKNGQFVNVFNVKPKLKNYVAVEN